MRSFNFTAAVPLKNVADLVNYCISDDALAWLREHGCKLGRDWEWDYQQGSESIIEFRFKDQYIAVEFKLRFS